MILGVLCACNTRRPLYWDSNMFGFGGLLFWVGGVFVFGIVDNAYILMHVIVLIDMSVL